MAEQRFLPLPCLYPSRPSVLDLGERFGAGGPYAFVVILCAAETQAQIGADGDRVTMTWFGLASEAFLADAEQARAIVDALAESGQITVERRTRSSFTVQLQERERFQPAKTDAQRARDYRARKGGRHGSVTEPS